MSAAVPRVTSKLPSLFNRAHVSFDLAKILIVGREGQFCWIV